MPRYEDVLRADVYRTEEDEALARALEAARQAAECLDPENAREMLDLVEERLAALDKLVEGEG